MKSLSRFFYYWAPPIVWIVVIFHFSSIERVVVSQQKLINFLFFKALHVIEYAILYFLFFRALHPFDKKTSISRKYFFSFVLAVLYASTDELHQTFVPTREGKVRDVFIDIVGMSIMYIYIKNKFEFVKKLL